MKHTCLSLVLGALAFFSPAQADTLNVLFIGNSYTYFNDMPRLFDSLAKSGGRAVAVDQYTVGGYTLEQHSRDSAALRKIMIGTWDDVILQEQSQIPSIPWCRDSVMYPAARRLDSLIRAYNGHSAFFMTWGRRYGGQQTWGGHSSPPFVNYLEMQDSLRTAYTAIASELSAGLAPVGMAWARAWTYDTMVDLWQSDNSHPTLKGSYLAACVFYAVLFDATPAGLSYYGGLDSAEARYFQEVAEHTVLGVAEPGQAVIDRQWSAAVAPNPCAGRTRILVSRAGQRPAAAVVEVCDLSGRIVRRLTRSASNAEYVEFEWDGQDGLGRPVPSGIYFARPWPNRAGSSARQVLRR